MRLGDLDALKSKAVPLLFPTKMEPCGHIPVPVQAVVVAEIEQAPTIDAVPVVRCKDCNRGRLKHMREEPCIECQLFHHEDPRQYKDLMDYCSHGVRKDGEG